MATRPSLSERISRNIHLIELVELLIVGVAFGLFVNIVAPGDGSLLIAALVVVGIPLVLWAVWGTYMLYIIFSRAGTTIMDFIVALALALVSGTLTFWCWTALDINRFIIRRLFYRGQRPVEYSWNKGSRERSKAWDIENKEQRAKNKALFEGSKEQSAI